MSSPRRHILELLISHFFQSYPHSAAVSLSRNNPAEQTKSYSIVAVVAVVVVTSISIPYDGVYMVANANEVHHRVFTQTHKAKLCYRPLVSCLSRASTIMIPTYSYIPYSGVDMDIGYYI